MIKRTLLATALSVFVVAPAFAGSCPVMVKAIDNAIASGTSLSAEDLATVKALRDQGDAQHAGGQHAESVATLQKAKDMLGIE